MAKRNIKKQYGFAFMIHDWKERISDIIVPEQRMAKLLPDDTQYYDIDIIMPSDCIYTVITNYYEMEELIESLGGEYVFCRNTNLGQDKNGIIWFDTPEEFKDIIEQRYIEDEKNDEEIRRGGELIKSDKNYEKIFLNWKKTLENMWNMGKAERRKLGVPYKILTMRIWSIEELAIYMTFIESGVDPNCNPSKPQNYNV